MMSLLKEKYWDLYYELKGDGITDIEAYTKIEAEVEKKHGIKRYSSFESFKTMKTRTVKSKHCLPIRKK